MVYFSAQSQGFSTSHMPSGSSSRYTQRDPYLAIRNTKGWEPSIAIRGDDPYGNLDGFGRPIKEKKKNKVKLGKDGEEAPAPREPKRNKIRVFINYLTRNWV